MDNIRPISSLSSSLQRNWDYVNELDEKVKAKEVLGGTLQDKLKTSARYRAQSQAIQHGTKSLLKDRWDKDLFKSNLSKHQGLNDLATKAANGAAGVGYESLVLHIKNGGAVNTFDWKGLIKGRAWNHVDDVTCITQGSAGAIGRALALSLAKFLIVFDAVKDAKTSYQNERNAGKNIFSSSFSAVVTVGKELGKSLISWEAGAFGAALATVLLPGLGLLAAIGGGVLIGGSVGYMLEKHMPSPKKEAVPVKSDSNPFS